jgi:hypothetical protein
MPTSHAVITSIIIDISKREIVFLSDIEDPKYITWKTADQFSYMYDLIQLESDKYDIYYTFSLTHTIDGIPTTTPKKTNKNRSKKV